MGEKKRIKVNLLAFLILRITLSLIFKRIFKMKSDLPGEILDLKPPYLLLLNHQGFWDPFLAGICLRYPTFYITSDAVFRSPFFKFLLNFLGAIPKTKAQSDLDALKNIFEIKKRGNIIGIFPEGQRSWDGSTLPLIQSTAKLVRMLKIPVVTVLFKGGFFSHPRWGTSIRTGRLLMEFRILFNGDEVAGMKVSDIHRRLTEALSFDEVEYQKKERIRFTGGHYAENIEQFLFACSSCGTIGSLRSKNNSFECGSCGKSWVIDDYHEIHASDGDTLFDNVRDWNKWQLEHLKSRLDRDHGTAKILLEDKGVVFHTGYKSRKLRRLSDGSIRLTSDNIILLSRDGNELRTIPMKDLSGINIQNREILDFYYDGVLYTVRDRERRFSSYKWLSAVEYLQREKLKMNLPL